MSPHCDASDGPFAKAVRRALETGTVNLILILVLAFLLVLPACHSSVSPPTASQTTTPTILSTSTPSGEVAPISLKVESAGPAWNDKFFEGLSQRTLVEGGMLFDFGEMVTVSFQMRETLIPLSIAFISNGKRILEIKDMEPLSEESYDPAIPYRYALEVNQGYFGENGIAVGDRIEFGSADSPDYLTILFLR
jgi:uncharacterized membrane protein (UPF0127 family)